MADENFFITGKVVEIGASSTGKPKVKIESNGKAKWYFAGRCDVSTMQLGQRVAIEGHAFPGPNGASLLGIDVWGADNAPSTPADVQPGQPRFPQQGLYQGAQSMPPTAVKPQETNGNYPAPGDQDTMKLLSNHLAALIASGHIKNLSQYREWWNGICATARGEKYFEKEIPN